MIGACVCVLVWQPGTHTQRFHFPVPQVSVPFFTGSQYEYLPICATFIAGYAVIVLEEQLGIAKAIQLVLGNWLCKW